MRFLQPPKPVLLFFCLEALCSQVLDASSDANCLLGGFYFARGRDMVVDHCIQGVGFFNQTVSSSRECFRECAKNCRCISFNFRRHLEASNCEVNEESRHTAPSSLKREYGCDNYDLVMDYSVLKGNTEKWVKCTNNCCKPNSCENKGNCSEVCDTQSKRFQCSCVPGYSGTVCQKTLKSCEDYYKTGVNTTGNYVILDEQNKGMTVYCDFSSESNFVWTLIQSFSFANKASFAAKPLYLTNAPIQEDNPNWASYRLSLSHLNFIRTRTTYWRATCNFPTDGVDFRDYVRSSFNSFDLMSSSAAGHGVCQKYEFLDIRGIQCSNCTAATWYAGSNSISFSLDSSKNKGCEFDARSGSVSSEDNFGLYAKTNPNFRCTASPVSTTQFWFGIPR